MISRFFRAVQGTVSVRFLTVGLRFRLRWCPFSWVVYPKLLMLTLLLVLSSIGCGEEKSTTVRGLGSGQQAKPKPEKEEATQGTGIEKEEGKVYADEDFVESERNRDPFRAYTTLFQAVAPEAPQRKVIMPTTAIENMNLIAIIGGIPAPKAMLVDTYGVGHVVERGVYLGRPEIVRASENVSMTLNWRVHRIRENEVVLTRDDPTDPSRPPLTRVIPLREKNLKNL